MKKIYYIPAVSLGLGLAAPALAEEMVSSEMKSETTIEKDTSGNYQKQQTRSAESVDAAGTKTSTETTVEIESDAKGNAEKKVTTETSTDPKGLMNKTKVETTDSVKYKDGNVEKKYKKTVDGKTVEEISEETSSN